MTAVFHPKMRPTAVRSGRIFIDSVHDDDTGKMLAVLGFADGETTDYVMLNLVETMKIRDELARIASWQAHQIIHRPQPDGPKEGEE